MESNQLPVNPEQDNPQRRMLWIGIAIIILLIVIVAAVAYALMSATKEGTIANTSPTSSSNESVVTKDDIKQDVEALDASLKQAKLDQEAMRAALSQDQEFKVED